MEVAFGNGTTTPDNKGAWNPFKGGKEFTFTKPAHIDKLVVLELCQPADLAKLLDRLHSVANERGLRLPRLNGPCFHRLDLSWRDLNHTNVLTGDKLDTFLLNLLGPRGLGLGSTDLVSLTLTLTLTLTLPYPNPG